MKKLKHLFDKNREWAESVHASDPEFFSKLSQQQTPQYLWIGCADSRVPANEITGLMPGEMFVHRNVANVVVHTDLNCLSVIQYAVEVLKVKHIIVCGHYGCGGVLAALENKRNGLIDNWLRHIQDVAQKHEAQLSEIEDAEQKFQRLCELNVIEQVSNVCQTTVVENAWEQGQDLSVHGWVYGLHNGLLHDLNICVTSKEELRADYSTAICSPASA
jgi:carbonic anhydrase